MYLEIGRWAVSPNVLMIRLPVNSGRVPDGRELCRSGTRMKVNSHSPMDWAQGISTQRHAPKDLTGF